MNGSQRSKNSSEANLCSLEEILSVCGTPDWISEEEIHLTVLSGSISFDTLRALEACFVFPSQLDPHLQASYDGGSKGLLEPGAVFTLRLPRVVSRSVVAKNLADLLSLPSATWQEPNAYFLIKEEESARPFCFIGEGSLSNASQLVKRYHQALSLWALLQGQAEHTTATKSLMFFGLRRTEINPRFGLDDLAENILLKEISDFLSNEDRQNTRAEIFHSVLSEFLRDQPAERGFAYLLRASALFAGRLVEGLSIYLSANSPEKLTEEATAKHFELAEKLEKVINGMEAKSLTIPAAVLLAVKEVRFGERWVTLNTVILASALLYLAAMTVAHLSQWAMLKLLKETINKAAKDLRDQGLDDPNPVLAVLFESLKARQKNSALLSWAMWLFSTVPLIAVWYAAFIAAPPPKPPTPDPVVQTASQLVIVSPTTSVFESIK